MSRRGEQRRSVAIIGTRGYPSFYGGFETAVRMLAPYLADHGWDVTVYGRPGGSPAPREFKRDPRVVSRNTPGLESKSLSTLSYGLTSSLDSARRKPDVALVMNVANGYWLPILKARGIPSVVNVDGIEWEREKWGRLARQVFFNGAKATARHADSLIYDARAIGDYWRANFDRDGTFIPYGGTEPTPLPAPMGLRSGEFILLVARFVPENTIGEFFAAAEKLANRHDVVIVGSSGYGGDLDERAKALAAAKPRVSWLGHLRDDDLLLALWQHCGVYFHGHSVGGTNPALVQAMACGAPVVARDTVYNREVLGDVGSFVEPEPDAIVAAIERSLAAPEDRERRSKLSRARVAEQYSWELVCSSYEAELELMRRR